MFLISTWALRLFGLCGITGALLFMAGDLLYNHVPGSSAGVAHRMSRLPPARLINAGSLGLVGCWFYTAAAGHLYLAFRPAGEVFAFVLLLAFAALAIGYGTAHTAYISIAAGAQQAVRLGGTADEGGRLGHAFFQRLTLIIYLPVAVSSLMMLYGIVSGHSLYPRWMVIFLPVILYLLKAPLVRILRRRLRELVDDCYDNIVFLVFFLLSTILLWHAVMV